MKEIKTDIVIVGSGLVGLVAAYSLSLLNHNVVIVDKKDFNELKAPKKDVRTVAVSEGSKVFLESLSLWNDLKKNAEPIKSINVLDRGPINKILFENLDKKKNLGYVIENSKLSMSIFNALKIKKNVKICGDYELKKIITDNQKSIIYSNNKKIKSKLIVAADGKNSTVRKILSDKIFKKNYKESALVLNFYHEKNLKNIAFEIFYNTGPLAILPMKLSSNHFQSSIIWTNNNNFVDKIIDCSHEFVKNILMEKVGDIVGNINKINSIQKFPLSAHINEKFYNNRLVYVGDSAHSIHPIAGQGWNLGIKDVKNLNIVCKEFFLKKEGVGNDIFCKKYNSLSYKNAFQLYQITDKLNLHFKRKEKIYRAISNKGFAFIDKNNNLKDKITNFAMGF